MVFVVDSSSSIRNANPPNTDNWDLILRFMIQIVDGLNIGRSKTRVGVVNFSNISRVEFPLDEYFTKSEVKNAIFMIPYLNSYTHTAAGLLDMRTKVFDPSHSNLRGDRRNVRNIAIVITDGESNENQNNTIPYADIAAANGILVLAVGISGNVNINEIKGISSTGVENDTYWVSADFRVADRIVRSITRKTCEKATIGE